MKIQFLYILNCPWCLKTKRLLYESLKELKVKGEVEEILVDSEEKSKKYKFIGSPTIRINGKDIQEKVFKDRCLPCEDLAKRVKKTPEFVKKQCQCGCRVFYYEGKYYSYPPKRMIKEALSFRLKG